jgi:hypothetical protein
MSKGVENTIAIIDVYANARGRFGTLLIWIEMFLGCIARHLKSRQNVDDGDNGVYIVGKSIFKRLLGGGLRGKDICAETPSASDITCISTKSRFSFESVARVTLNQHASHRMMSVPLTTTSHHHHRTIFVTLLTTMGNRAKKATKKRILRPSRSLGAMSVGSKRSVVPNIAATATRDDEPEVSTKP